MSFIPTRRAFLVSAVAMTLLPLTGCKSKTQTDTVRKVAPYEGEYKNSKGNVVLEIKEGAIHYKDPKTQAKAEAPFMVQGDKLVIESNIGNFSLTIAPDGSITGLPVAVAGDTAPLKKS